MRENGKKILLVEDNAIIALAEKQALEKSGFAVVTATSGDAPLYRERYGLGGEHARTPPAFGFL